MFCLREGGGYKKAAYFISIKRWEGAIFCLYKPNISPKTTEKTFDMQYINSK